ncbi:30S ribosomal protein s6 [Plakobranchus ocellatus]|uniref:30S ribosomal protein s6 n=1 Tax=Plakobranchus ocellatus TaxID=259542 RepID=A0AAV4DPV6_9GAST|nr:30S ribosomal protein s6 [Plakobranchus ocellatus]
MERCTGKLEGKEWKGVLENWKGKNGRVNWKTGREGKEWKGELENWMGNNGRGEIETGRERMEGMNLRTRRERMEGMNLRTGRERREGRTGKLKGKEEKKLFELST